MPHPLPALWEDRSCDQMIICIISRYRYIVVTGAGSPTGNTQIGKTLAIGKVRMRSETWVRTPATTEPPIGHVPKGNLIGYAYLPDLASK